MTVPRDDLRDLLDRRAIEDMHARYFRGLDRGEPELVRSCFTDDVVARYDGRSALRPGREAAVRGIDAVIDGLVTFGHQRSGEWKVTMHLLGQVNLLSLDGDDAETEIYAIACLVLRRTPADLVTQRGLRYLDRLRRTPAGWRISERVHTLDWSADAPASFTITMAARRMDR